MSSAGNPSDGRGDAARRAPRFSIVIPTLARADTLEHTLRATLCQTEPDFEIVVQSNGADPAVADVVDRLADARLRLHETERVCPMTENWELALANARGEWITFVGDDDALLPDACAAVDRIAALGELELVSWQPFMYYWPSYADPGRRNTLAGPIDFASRVSTIASRPLLERFYAFGAHYSVLPMIYNSFVRRPLVDRVVARLGRYFHGNSPDVTSGIVNAASSDAFLRCGRPLSVSGISHHSTGHNRFRADPDIWSDALTARDFAGPGRLEGAEFNLELFIASDMLLLQRLVLRDDPSVVFDARSMLNEVAAQINERPELYDVTRAALAGLGEQFGIDAAEIPVPAPIATRPPVPRGVARLAGRDEVHFALDGARIGLTSIADAAALVTQLLPSVDELQLLEPEDDRSHELAAGEMRFGRGSGAAALVSGWAEQEAWGTWSTGSEARIRVHVVDDATRSIAIGYRVLIPPDTGMRSVEVVVGDHVASHTFDVTSHRGELVVGPVVSLGMLEIVLRNGDTRSPAELGIGSDERQLGIGIEYLRPVLASA